jgi:F-type H+-transporting ATPase subunit b
MTNRTRLLCALALMLLAATPIFAAEGGTAEAGWAPSIAKLINFGLLAAIIVYFGRGPIGEYLRTRSGTIRKDLVDSKALRAQAEQQLAGVKQRLALLPGELEEMKRRGKEELAAEKVRLAEATAHERQRLLDQTRREIELQSRLARRDLVQHSVELSIALARTRIEKGMTPDDQARLIDRYAAGVRA